MAGKPVTVKIENNQASIYSRSRFENVPIVGRFFRRELAHTEPITEFPLSQLINEMTDRTGQMHRVTAGRLGEYKPDSLDPDTIERMLKNGAVSSGLIMLKAPIYSVINKGEFVCSDPIVAATLNEYLKPVIVNHLSTILTCMEWGCSFQEKVFEVIENLKVTYKDEVSGTDQEVIFPQFINYKKLKFNHYSTIEDIIVHPETGDFNGYVQQKNSIDKVYVAPAKAFVFALKTDNSLWGETVLTQAYAPWYAYELLSNFYVRYAEYGAFPPLIGRAPIGSRRVPTSTGFRVVDNLTWLAAIGQQAGNAKVIVFPAEYDIQSGELDWDLRELKISDHTELFKDALAWLERAIKVGLFVPQQATGHSADDTGNNNVGESEFDAFMITEAQRITTLTNAINKWIVPPIVDLNFGAGLHTVKFVVPDVTQENVTRTFQLVSQLIKAGHPQSFAPDLIAMFKRLGQPVDESIMQLPSTKAKPDAPEDEDKP